jgi:hypothetical protein
VSIDSFFVKMTTRDVGRRFWTWSLDMEIDGSGRNKIPGFRIMAVDRKTPMKRSLIGFCLLLVLQDHGLCQTTKAKPAFYIVLNSLTKTCTVVDRMPQADTPNITLASDAIFGTRGEAEAAIKAVKPCN